MNRITPTLATFNPLSPRTIRLVRGIVTCPRCDKKCFHSVLQSGWAFQRCDHGRCDMEFWVLALPPDCFGGWLSAICGEHVAASLIVRCWPELANTSPPYLWYTQLIEGDDPSWIQIAVRPRERHLYRTANISDLLPKLLVA